eukprot:6195785-Pleurochrysis_carterae.AAC.1
MNEKNIKRVVFERGTKAGLAMGGSPAAAISVSRNIGEFLVTSGQSVTNKTDTTSCFAHQRRLGRFEAQA